jgi:predicted Fe-S protein YdhL (DUF1289 family)
MSTRTRNPPRTRDLGRPVAQRQLGGCRGCARLQDQVDPQGKLPPGERDRLVRAAARAFSARLNSAKSRKQRPALPTLRDSGIASASAATPGRGTGI